MTPTNNGSYAGLDQRAAPRTDVYARLPVLLPDGRSTKVKLVNISSDGFLMRLDQTIAEDGPVIATLPVIGKRRGRCAWALGGRAGVQFDERIAEHDYAALLRALGVRPPANQIADAA
jgi:hypothetical protein